MINLINFDHILELLKLKKDNRVIYLADLCPMLHKQYPRLLYMNDDNSFGLCKCLSIDVPKFAEAYNLYHDGNTQYALELFQQQLSPKWLNSNDYRPDTDLSDVVIANHISIIAKQINIMIGLMTRKDIKPIIDLNDSELISKELDKLFNIEIMFDD